MYQAGDQVVMTANHSERCYFPKIGTVGTVLRVEVELFVQWPAGSTSDNDQWFVPKNHVKLYRPKSDFGFRYLIFGECDGFGNDIYLCGVAATLEDARKIVKEKCSFYGQSFYDFSFENQLSYLEPIQISPEEIASTCSNTGNGGIYEIMGEN